MRGAAARDFRRQAAKVANYTTSVLSKPIETALKDAESALGNEAITRRRVDVLEADVLALRAFRKRPFWQRFRWLLSGK